MNVENSGLCMSQENNLQSPLAMCECVCVCAYVDVHIVHIGVTDTQVFSQIIHKCTMKRSNCSLHTLSPLAETHHTFQVCSTDSL